MPLPPRSLLFVPGDRPDRFAKALSSGADAICLDLEDAVAPEAKSAARDHVLAFLHSAEASDRIFIRMSSLATRAGLADLLALSSRSLGGAGVMMAKVDDPAMVTAALGCLAEGGAAPPILALIEDAKGLRRAHETAAVPGVIGLCLGSVDMAAGFAATFDEQAMTTLRLHLRAAAAENGVGTWDGPSTDISSEAGLAVQARDAAALGFSGKLCIHPRQVEVVNAAFAPSARAVAEAQSLLAAADATQAGAFMHAGKMVDAPVIAAARQLLSRVR